jgi:hypothetical protein
MQVNQSKKVERERERERQEQTCLEICAKQSRNKGTGNCAARERESRKTGVNSSIGAEPEVHNSIWECGPTTGENYVEGKK